MRLSECAGWGSLQGRRQKFSKGRGGFCLGAYRARVDFCLLQVGLRFFYGAYITTLVRQVSAQDSLLSVSVRSVLVFSTLLDLRAEENRVRRHVKPPRCGEASRKPRALSWERTRAIGALAHGFADRALRRKLVFILQLIHRELGNSLRSPGDHPRKEVTEKHTNRRISRVLRAEKFAR